ncbi:MAG: molybdopterin molybdenumtransferase MoeA [Oxalobacter sp.]|nr:MAG: molybdopterin molybdenumtransferase MoeA [Oxalobacter sp.]
MPPSPPTLSDIVNSLSHYDPDAIPVEQAKAVIQNLVSPVESVEMITLHHALGRVLAGDVLSPLDVPGHDNSAMDGYAFRGADISSSAPTRLKIVGSALAGQVFLGTVQTGECVQIMTGAVMPKGCDTVIPQESLQDIHADYLTLPHGVVRTGDNRRLKGEDLLKGSVAIKKGTLLRPVELGLLASLGMAEVTVKRKLRVAIFSTGDELVSLGEPLSPGNVYDSNRYTLMGMLSRLGCDILDMGIVRDDPALLQTAFRDACENADAIITSGGVSVGAADFTKQVMATLGDVAFWKIGMRPGRPMAFGKIHNQDKSAILFGLPGNPVAVMVTFYFLVRDALLSMMGATPSPVPLIRAKALFPIPKKAGRTEYQRGIATRGENGELVVRLTGSQGSGVLRSMSEANCMIILPHEQSAIAKGEDVDIILFDGLI